MPVQLDAVHALFALFFLSLQSYTFLRRQCQLMAGPGFELRTSCTGRANATHTPPRQNTLALPKCPAVRDAHHATPVPPRLLVRADKHYQLWHGMSNRFSRAHCELMRTASPARQWRASSPPFLFANLSPPRQSFMFLLNYVCSRTITTL